MSYKILLYAHLLITIYSYTDITMLNCPAQYNIAKYNTTTDTTVSTYGPFIYSSFQNEQSQTKVQSIVLKGDQQQLQQYSKQLMIPYIIFGVVYFIFFLFVVTCCLFDRSCPPCQSIRRNPDQDAYSVKQIRVWTIVLLVCAIGVLVVTLVGFSFVPDMKETLQMTNCGIYITYDTAINGDGTWGGFTSLRDKIGNITNLLSAAVTQVQIYFPGDAWLVDSMQSMRTDNIDIYSTYKDSRMTTPDPVGTATANNAGQSPPLVDSRFIKTGMGPNGTANRMVTDIDAGLRTTKVLSDQAYSITQSADLLQSSLSTILSNSLASQTTLMMYNHQLGVSVQQYSQFSKQYFEDNFSIAITVFQIVFGMALTGSLVILLGVVATHLFDLLVCRKMVHLGWTIYGIAYIGVIIIMYYTVSVGSISYGFCQYYQKMLIVKVSYDRIGTQYTQNMFTRLDTCIFGDGNAMQKFSIASQMATVTNLFTNIQTYYDYTNTISTNYINPSISTGKISGWITAVQNYKLGIYIDTDPSITNNDNPNYAINQLNLYTYQGGGVTTGSKDVWVWDKNNCTDNTQIVYNATVAVGTSLSTTQVTCISFNQKLSTNSPTRWSFSDFTMRYVQIRQSHADAYKEIVYYGQTLIAFRDSRINLFQAIQDDLTVLLTANTNFNTQLATFKDRVDQFYATVSTLNNLITNSVDGLVATSNCKSINDKLKFVYNTYCINFMAQIVKIAICAITLLVLMFIAVIAGSRFGIMYAQLEKVKRVTQPQEMETQNDIKGVGRLQDQMYSTYSNDSDQ